MAKTEPLQYFFYIVPSPTSVLFTFNIDTDKERDNENHQLSDIILMYRQILKH